MVDIQRSIYFRHTKSYWLNAQDMWLNNNWGEEWAQFINSLNMEGIELGLNKDELVWVGNHDSRQVSGKMAYFVITDNSVLDVPKWWFEFLWKWHLPSKLWLGFKH